MPYYLDEDMDGHDDYADKFEEDPAYKPPESQFTYVDPWQANTTVLSFSETPGAEPELLRAPRYIEQAGVRGVFALLFGQKADPAPKMQQRTPEGILEYHTKMQATACAHQLWQVSRLAARCRGLEVKRVFGSYDGGGDESFTHFAG